MEAGPLRLLRRITDVICRSRRLLARRRLPRRCATVPPAFNHRRVVEESKPSGRDERADREILFYAATDDVAQSAH